MRSLLGWGARAAAAAITVAAVGAVFAPGCSLVIDGDATQCTKDEDCKDIPGTTCDVANGVCSGGGGDCTVNADCAAKGQNFICRKTGTKTCVQLTSENCPSVEGDWQNDDAVIFGFIAPLSGADVGTGETILNGARLGIQDVNKIKLPPVPGSTKSRPIALVACDDTSDNATAVKAAHHLVDDVGVQAILGAAYSGITLDVASQVTIPSGVLLMSPSATSTLISDYPDSDPKCIAACGADQACKDKCPGLIWRTSPSDTFQAAAIAKYFENGLEDEVRARIMTPPFTGDIKVAVAYKGDAYGTGLRDVIETILKFNNKTALSQLNTNYKAFDYGNPNDPASDPLKYDEAVTGIVAFKPDIVLAFGTNEAIVDSDPPTNAGIYTRVETTWTGGMKPFWIFTDGGLVHDLTVAAATLNAADRTRVTSPGTDAAVNVNYQKFTSAYQSLFSTDPNGGPEVFGGAGAYDIVYLLSIAAVSAQDRPLTGAEFARGLARTSMGTGINVGQAQLNVAFSTMSTASGSIDFNGASGPLDWDLKRGEAVSDIVIWCLPKNGMDSIPSGLLYSAANETISGMLSTNCAGQ
ncbi:MAG: ABC transporter substrate-binding protein [Polyangiaceae bacterium]